MWETFKELLDIIGQPSNRALTVFQSISKALEIVYNRQNTNDLQMNELRGMFEYITNRTETDKSSTEVVGARGGKANLNARLVNIENNIDEIFSFVESNQPVYVKETRTEKVAFGRTTQNDDTLLPSQSYIKTPGVEGTVTLEVTIEYIGGVAQREVSRLVKSRVDPVNEVYVQGTKAAIANRPIRYIRFVTRLSGKQEGRWVEIEAFAGATKLTNANTVVLIPSGKFAENGTSLLFDGSKQYWSTIIAAPNPYVQIDLGSARTDITRAVLTLHPGSNYGLINIEVSSDNKTFYRVYSKTNHGVATLGQEITVDMNTLYRTDPISTFTDTTAVLPGAADVPIGGLINVKKGVTRIYPNAGVAAIKSGGLTYGGNASSLTVVYKAYVTNIRPTTGSPQAINSTTWYVVSSSNSMAKPAGTFLIIYSDASAGWFREDDL